MTKENKRILMATDIPYWNAKTGAEQRMLALVKFLRQPPFEITTFYVGAVTPEDHRLILAHGLEVVFFENEKPPAEFISRMKWYLDATKNQIQKWMAKSKPVETDEEASRRQPIVPLKLADYRWPWAMDQFRRLCERYRPHYFIAQYVTMGYLLDAIPSRDRPQIHCLLDTHDILHDRGLQFGAAGYLHWLDIERQEEIDVWNKFDTVIAIQDNEAALIRSLAKNPDVLVVGHAPTSPGVIRPRANESGCLRIGYIGSANYSNWHAINRFLIEVWPELLTLEGVEVELVVAGKICQWMEMMEPDRQERMAANRVRLFGEVQSLGDFYEAVDIVVNPVQFGTGLKIKNVEALAYGKPLVTTESGAGGMNDSMQEGCIKVDTLREMANQLVKLCEDRELQHKLSQRALRIANRELSETAVYSELARHLLNSSKKGFQKLPSR